ncbi:MAG: ABC transporter permease subunit, partial [Pseudomonadota bacterium]
MRVEFLDLNERSQAEYRARFTEPGWTDVDSADAPYTTRRAFAYPTPLLADFTIGRSHLEPTLAQVRMGYRSDTLFKNYQIDNPERLQRGVFDLSFVVIVIAPLLLIGLGYGLFSEDRDSGTARLILVQSGGIGRLLVARSFNRLALVATPLLIATIILIAMGPEEPGRSGAAAVWLINAIVGLLFWWAIILLLNVTRISAETAALTLIAIWVVLVFVAPPLISAMARSVYPPPSRMDQIIASRVAELDATDRYANDHPADGLPEIQRVKEVIAEYHRISLAHERSIRPMSERFEEGLAHQQTLAEWLQLASPPMALATTLADIS